MARPVGSYETKHKIREILQTQFPDTKFCTRGVCLNPAVEGANECEEHRAYRKAYNDKYVKERKHSSTWQDRRRNNWIKTTYHIGMEEVYNLLNLQGGKCAICGAVLSFGAKVKNDQPHIDHDHSTGRIRGLLCSKCNTAIGMLHDDISLVQSALNYLTTHSVSE